MLSIKKNTTGQTRKQLAHKSIFDRHTHNRMTCYLYMSIYLYMYKKIHHECEYVYMYCIHI